MYLRNLFIGILISVNYAYSQPLGNSDTVSFYITLVGKNNDAIAGQDIDLFKNNEKISSSTVRCEPQVDQPIAKKYNGFTPQTCSVNFAGYNINDGSNYFLVVKSNSDEIIAASNILSVKNASIEQQPLVKLNTQDTDIAKTNDSNSNFSNEYNLSVSKDIPLFGNKHNLNQTVMMAGVCPSTTGAGKGAATAVEGFSKLMAGIAKGEFWGASEGVAKIFKGGAEASKDAGGCPKSLDDVLDAIDGIGKKIDKLQQTIDSNHNEYLSNYLREQTDSINTIYNEFINATYIQGISLEEALNPEIDKTSDIFKKVVEIIRTQNSAASKLKEYSQNLVARLGEYNNSLSKIYLDNPDSTFQLVDYVNYNQALNTTAMDTVKVLQRANEIALITLKVILIDRDLATQILIGEDLRLTPSMTDDELINELNNIYIARVDKVKDIVAENIISLTAIQKSSRSFKYSGDLINSDDIVLASVSNIKFVKSSNRSNFRYDENHPLYLVYNKPTKKFSVSFYQDKTGYMQKQFESYSLRDLTDRLVMETPNMGMLINSIQPMYVKAKQTYASYLANQEILVNDKSDFENHDILRVCNQTNSTLKFFYNGKGSNQQYLHYGSVNPSNCMVFNRPKNSESYTKKNLALKLVNEDNYKLSLLKKTNSDDLYVDDSSIQTVNVISDDGLSNIEEYKNV